VQETTEIPGVRMKGIQNKKKMYISGTNCHTRIRFTSSERKTLKVFFYARLTRMRRHISATMLGITWTERWMGDGSAEVDRSLGLLGRQI
jgi:hypothetical protein